ncbi:inorganic diphosphatase [Candidatus Saccharibacteria bacterium]|nr:inorganic diphosphatase [Candidatus Saccharibacteria bacterium]
MGAHEVHIGSDAPKVVNVIIEIPRGSGNKYELDKETGMIFLDRVQPTNLKQPADYGYVPETLGEDGDPLDALIVIDEPLFPGVVVPCRVIGVINMIDDGERDEKLVCVAADDKHYEHVVSVSDLGAHFKDKVTHYFEHYKDLQDKEVEIASWGSADDAYAIIEKYRLDKK